MQILNQILWKPLLLCSSVVNQPASSGAQSIKCPGYFTVHLDGVQRTVKNMCQAFKMMHPAPVADCQHNTRGDSTGCNPQCADVRDKVICDAV